jgi:hypothetical protein
MIRAELAVAAIALVFLPHWQPATRFQRSMKMPAANDRGPHLSRLGDLSKNGILCLTSHIRRVGRSNLKLPKWEAL